MTTITFEVPDELAARWQVDPARLSKLAQEALEAKLAQPAIATLHIYEDVPAFLATNPSLQQMIDFKVSDAAQARLEELLERNRESVLTAEEQTELDKYMQYHHLMIVLKASARRGRQPQRLG